MIRGYIRRQNQLVQRQKYSNVGAADFYLYPYRDPCLFLERDLHIFTSPTGWDQLTERSQFIITSKDAIYSDVKFEDAAVASTIRIIDPAYQTGDIYITYRWVADYLSSDMMNRFDRALDQMTNSVLTDLSGNSLINNSGNLVVQGTSWPGFRTNLSDYNELINDPPDLPLD